MVYAFDMGSSQTGSQTDYTNFCASLGMSTPSSYPASGNTYGSGANGSSLQQTAVDFFFNTMVPVFPSANYDNILILQGSNSDCWAHNAETGSMYAFGGPSGSGYAFCRGGSATARQYHIYICKI
jgi:hypothetical protein